MWSARPAPMGVADSWCGDSKLMPPVREAHQGPLFVEGPASYGFPLADGRQVTGHDLSEGQGWRGQQHPWEAGVRDVRLRATSPTYGSEDVLQESVRATSTYASQHAIIAWL